MTREEQLNIISDEEANKALTRQIVLNRKADFYPMPNIHCYLVHQGNFVVCSETKILEWCQPSSELQQYYAAKYGWSPTLTSCVDWDGLSGGIKRCHKYKFIAKLLCSWLPSLSFLAKRENIDDRCSQCHCTESNDHVFTCKFRVSIHTSFIRRFTLKLLEMHTCPALIQDFISGYKNVVQGTSLPLSTKAGIHQSRLGWIHLFRGFLSSLWHQQQDDYIRSLKPGPQDANTHVWASKIVSLLLDHSHDLWMSRCETIHASISKRETAQQRRRAIAHVKALYSHAPNVSYDDRDLFFGTPIAEKLREPATTLLLWCQSIKGALRRAIADQKHRQARTQRVILFTSTRPDTPAHKRSPCSHRSLDHSTVPIEHVIPKFVQDLISSKNASVSSTVHNSNHPV